jgi:predicted metal-dependent hydrolase
MTSTRRDVQVTTASDNIIGCHASALYVAHFVNALSLMVPDGERYIVHTLRSRGGRVSALSLGAAVADAIDPGAMLGDEHARYHEQLADAGLPTAELQAHADRLFESIKLVLTQSEQLALTIALKHITAIVSELLLRDPSVLCGVDPRLVMLWHQHVRKEGKQFAVAFDVYEETVGCDRSAYALRSFALSFATFGILLLSLYYQQRLVAADCTAHQWRSPSAFARFTLESCGMLLRLGAPWLAWFKPGCHPWQQDLQLEFGR